MRKILLKRLSLI